MKQDEFREILIRDLRPCRRLASPQTQLQRFMGIVLVLSISIIVFGGVREDFAQQTGRYSYYGEMVGLLLFVIAAGFAALFLTRPGFPVKKPLLACTFIASVWPLYVVSTAPDVETVLPHSDISCAGLVVMSTILFGSILLTMLSRGYLARPLLTYFAGFLCATAVGGVLLHFVCPGQGLHHLLYFHLAPIYILPVPFALALFIWQRVIR